MVCGIEVDRRGKELASVGPRRRNFMAPDQYLRACTKWQRIAFTAALFCGVVTYHLLMLKESRVNFTWFVAFTVTSLAIVETAVGGLIFYFVSRYRLKRYFRQDGSAVSRSGRTVRH